MATTSTPRSDTVLRRHWSPDPGGLLELWRHESPRTRRIFALFARSDLSWAPAPDTRTIGELLRHVVASYHFARRWLHQPVLPSPEIGAFSSVTEALRMLAEAQDELFDALAHSSLASFDTVISPFGQPETVSVMGLGMLKHEIHHRGELYALARVRGRTPPPLYGPSSE